MTTKKLEVIRHEQPRITVKVCEVQEVNELKSVIQNLLDMLIAVKGIDRIARIKTEAMLKGLENREVFVEKNKEVKQK